MTNSDLLKVILTSSLIAGVVSAIISALIAIKLKSLEYRNEYFKRILEKRLDAYQYLEKQIAVFKSSVLSQDGRPYHAVFSLKSHEILNFQTNLLNAMAYSIWINEDTVKIIEKWNEEFYKISNELDAGNPEDNVVEIGKQHYEKIADFRNQLEDAIRRDILDLHNLKAFKKTKRIRDKRVFTLER